MPEEEIILNENYWDCECEHNFIHQRDELFCPACGARREDQPDSRQNEILEGADFYKGPPAKAGL